jgi:hypothetical protein
LQHEPIHDRHLPEFVERGKLLVFQKQFHEAVRICRLGLLAHPTVVEGRLILGVALMALGRYEDVLAEMRAALELDPENTKAHVLKAEALIELEDVRGAYQALVRALESDPEDSKALALLSEIESDYDSESGDSDPMKTDTKVYPARAAQQLPGPSDSSIAELSESAIAELSESAIAEISSVELINSEELNVLEIEPDGLAGRDFAGRDLAGRDFDGRDLAGRDLDGRDLDGRDLAERDLADIAESTATHDEDARYTTAPWLPPKPSLQPIFGSGTEDTEVQEDMLPADPTDRERIAGIDDNALRLDVSGVEKASWDDWRDKDADPAGMLEPATDEMVVLASSPPRPIPAPSEREPGTAPIEPASAEWQPGANADVLFESRPPFSLSDAGPWDIGPAHGGGTKSVLTHNEQARASSGLMESGEVWRDARDHDHDQADSHLSSTADELSPSTPRGTPAETPVATPDAAISREVWMPPGIKVTSSELGADPSPFESVPDSPQLRAFSSGTEVLDSNDGPQTQERTPFSVAAALAADSVRSQMSNDPGTVELAVDALEILPDMPPLPPDLSSEIKLPDDDFPAERPAYQKQPPSGEESDIANEMPSLPSDALEEIDDEDDSLGTSGQHTRIAFEKGAASSVRPSLPSASMEDPPFARRSSVAPKEAELDAPLREGTAVLGEDASTPVGEAPLYLSDLASAQSLPSADDHYDQAPAPMHLPEPVAPTHLPDSPAVNGDAPATPGLINAPTHLPCMDELPPHQPPAEAASYLSEAGYVEAEDYVESEPAYPTGGEVEAPTHLPPDALLPIRSAGDGPPGVLASNVDFDSPSGLRAAVGLPDQPDGMLPVRVGVPPSEPHRGQRDLAERFNSADRWAEFDVASHSGDDFPPAVSVPREPDSYESKLEPADGYGGGSPVTALEPKDAAFLPYVEAQPASEPAAGDQPPTAPQIPRAVVSRRKEVHRDPSLHEDLTGQALLRESVKPRGRRRPTVQEKTSWVTLLMGESVRQRWVRTTIALSIVLLALVGGFLFRYWRIGNQIDSRESNAHTLLLRGNIGDYQRAAQRMVEVGAKQTTRCPGERDARSHQHGDRLRVWRCQSRKRGRCWRRRQEHRKGRASGLSAPARRQARQGCRYGVQRAQPASQQPAFTLPRWSRSVAQRTARGCGDAAQTGHFAAAQRLPGARCARFGLFRARQRGAGGRQLENSAEAQRQAHRVTFGNGAPSDSQAQDRQGRYAAQAGH